MADGLYTIGDVLIADHVRDVLPLTSEGNRVENKMLDGSAHVQTVGTPIVVLTMSISVADTVAESIDALAAASTEVKVLWLTRWATGYIREVPQWTLDGYRYYTATIQLLVTDQGDQA